MTVHLHLTWDEFLLTAAEFSRSWEPEDLMKIIQRVSRLSSWHSYIGHAGDVPVHDECDLCIIEEQPNDNYSYQDW